MSKGSPLSGNIRVGTADKGLRSEPAEKVRRVEDRAAATPGGEEDIIWVDEVGIGVGYFETAGSRATRFEGRGREGDELKGSKAGSREAGRFTPATGARELLVGEESILTGALFFPHKLLLEREIIRARRLASPRLVWDERK